MRLVNEPFPVAAPNNPGTDGISSFEHQICKPSEPIPIDLLPVHRQRVQIDRHSHSHKPDRQLPLLSVLHIPAQCVYGDG